MVAVPNLESPKHALGIIWQMSHPKPIGMLPSWIATLSGICSRSRSAMRCHLLFRAPGRSSLLTVRLRGWLLGQKGPLVYKFVRVQFLQVGSQSIDFPRICASVTRIPGPGYSATHGALSDASILSDMCHKVSRHISQVKRASAEANLPNYSFQIFILDSRKSGHCVLVSDFSNHLQHHKR